MRKRPWMHTAWLRGLLKAPSDRAVSLLLFLALIAAILANPRILHRSMGAGARGERLILSSLLYSSRVWGERFPVLVLQDVVGGRPLTTLFREPTLVLLFSTSDCSDCVRHALGLLEQLRSRCNPPLSVAAIGTGKSRSKVLALRKVSQSKYRFLYDPQGLCADSLRAVHLPMMMLVAGGNRILCAYTPVPGLPEYSVAYASAMANLALGLNGRRRNGPMGAETASIER